MASLLTYRDMVERYEGGENAFEISIDKWKRIKENVETASTPQHFHNIFESASLKVPLCIEYEDNCSVCPLNKVCSRGEDGSFNKFMRALHAFCIAGDVLPKPALLSLADEVILELEECRGEAKKLVS